MNGGRVNLKVMQFNVIVDESCHGGGVGIIAKVGQVTEVNEVHSDPGGNAKSVTAMWDGDGKVAYL